MNDLDFLIEDNDPKLQSVIRFLRFHKPELWTLENYNLRNSMHKFDSAYSWGQYKRKAKRILGYDKKEIKLYYVVRLLDKDIYRIKATTMGNLKSKLLMLSRKIKQEGDDNWIICTNKDNAKFVKRQVDIYYQHFIRKSQGLDKYWDAQLALKSLMENSVAYGTALDVYTYRHYKGNINPYETRHYDLSSYRVKEK
jgi:hypothetical protein